MMDNDCSRALLLLQQGRFDMAEKEINQLIFLDPQNSMAHALLGLCLSENKKFKEAQIEAETAVSLSPDEPFCYYVLAHVLHDRNKLKQALKVLDDAINMDPENPDFFALKANILINLKQWPEALQVAEHGLSQDPRHVECINMQAMALLNSGRKEDASAAVESALVHDPDNEVTHANRGWTYLQQGQPEKAMSHFQEALRINPDLEWARNGIIEALKAKNFIYSLMLKYFFFMSRLTGRMQFGILIGGYLAYRVLLRAASDQPQLSYILWPLVIMYILFAYLTWTAAPLFNLTLRLSRFGRLALSKKEIADSNWIGLCVFCSLASLGCWFFTMREGCLIAMLVFAVMVIPLRLLMTLVAKRERLL